MADAAELKSGLIVKTVSDLYYVDCGDDLYKCKAKGKFRNISLSPLVGDRVSFEVLSEQEKFGRITDIAPRKNSLIRPAVANIDTLVIVSSVSLPRPFPLVIDKITAVAEHRNIPPTIVFNKTDEGDSAEYAEIYAKTGYPLFEVSAVAGEGIDALRAYLTGKISALCGNSGVGKSSLLNRLCPSAAAETGDVSLKLRRGKHTTRHTELIKTGFGGYIADTPGFSSWTFTGGNHIEKDELQYCFAEFCEFIPHCRFASCTHTKEQGCAVIAAVEEGLISRVRHDDYIAVYNELKGIDDHRYE